MIPISSLKPLVLNRGLITTMVLAFSSISARADEFEDLKVTIQARSETIRRFKAESMLTEGGVGFLVLSTTATAEVRNVADAENAARLKMFGLIATRSGKAVDEVARHYADLAGSSPAPLKVPTSHDSSAIPGDFVPVSPGSSLPLKVLARPSSPMYESTSDSSRMVVAELPAFSAWVVRSQAPGWYQVSETLSGKVAGWIKTSDAIEWKHHMVVSFTHPGNRSRNLIFKEKQPLIDLLAMSQDQRASTWDKEIKDTLDGRNLNTVGIEPEGWLREKNQFYLLPIFDQQEVQSAGQETTLLKIAAATRERATEATQAPRKKRTPQLDVVFVMDLTRSMGPFVNKTMEMLQGITANFQNAEASGASIRFGIWGYRDNPELCRGIEFNTRNYTPELQEIGSFVKTLESVNETKVDSIDYAEDVFAGMTDAIQKTRWRENSARMILLVGDAPGRSTGETEPECRIKPAPKGTSSGLDATAVRALANASSVYVGSYYLEASKWKNFTARGAGQFKTLSRNPGSSDPDFALLNADNPSDYAAAGETFASRLAENLRKLADEGSLPQKESDRNTAPSAGNHMADNLFRNAFIEWKSAGTDLKPPRDVEGWMVDKDPVESSHMSLEPGVLLTKTQLSDLRDRVNNIIDAMLRVEVGGQDFFKELNAVVTIGGRDPGRIRDARTLMDSGHFPDFLTGLPYKSKIMGMTKDDWREMGADQANQYRNEIVSKVQFYAEIYKDATKWQKLNSNSESGDYVTPIPIDMLP
ncbi:MAG: vWA domain-containing protein [Luteolibacter sp.]